MVKNPVFMLVDRPQGHPVYLLILVKTAAKFFVNSKWTETPAGVAVVFKAGQRHLYGPLNDHIDFPAYIDDWMQYSSLTEDYDKFLLAEQQSDNK